MGKEVKNKISYKTEEQKEITKLVIIILVVVIMVAGAYLLTRAFVTKDLFKKDTTEEKTVIPGEVSHDVTIVGSILNRPYNEYYVAVYNSDNKTYAPDMTNIVSSYNAKSKHLHIYTVDLDNKFNEDYYDPENVKLDTNKVEDLRFGDVTLLKISKGKISKAITDLEKIKKELGV
jgi:hypothetical protein